MSFSLYKYMPDRINFFDNYLLRASSKLSLNDPFESSPSAEFWADLCLITKTDRYGKTKDEIISYINRQPDDSLLEELGTSILRDHGIISFSETRDNLLLWSHYANNHRGVVIEFDAGDDFFHNKYKDDHDDLVGVVTRVKYRKERITSVGNNPLMPYFHKSDEWSYEKEYRLLLPSNQSSEVFLPNTVADELISNGQLRRSDITIYDNNLVKVITNQSWLTMHPETLLMFEVPCHCIRSVTFGCRATHKFKSMVVEKLKSNGLVNVKVYESVKDKLDYRLRFKSLI